MKNRFMLALLANMQSHKNGILSADQFRMPPLHPLHPWNPWWSART